MSDHAGSLAPRVWITILIGVLVSIDFGLWVIGFDIGHTPSFAMILGFLAGQLGLVAIWWARGNWPSWPARLVLVTAVAMALTIVASFGGVSSGSFWMYSTLFGVQIVLTAVVMRSIRQLAFQFVGSDGNEIIASRGLSTAQISIQDMMILTAGVGFVAGMMIYLFPAIGGIWINPGALLTIGLFGFCLTTISVAVVVATLFFNRVLIPTLLALNVAVMNGYILAFTLDRSDGWVIIDFTIASAVVQLAVLCVLRGLGYRVGRRDRRLPVETIESERAGVRL